MTSNAYFNSGGGSTSNLDSSSNKQNSPSSSNFNANQLGNQLINGTNFTNNNFQLSNYSALNLNLNSNTVSPSNSINSPSNSNGPSLLNNLPSPSRHQQNFLNFNNPALNSQMNNNILNSTVSRPQHLNQQLMSTDPTFTALDPTDFPVLHRSSHSPFQLQTQQLQQLQQQLRNSSYQNAPSSAPILNSASTQNLILQFANQMSASNNNLSNSANATSMLMMMNNNSANNLAQLSTNYLLHHHNSTNQVGSGKMWSNFNPSKDFRLKSQQSGLDGHHQEFNIQQEDFPALPRPQSVHNKSESQPNLNINSTDQNLKTSSTVLFFNLCCRYFYFN
ncbi:unnamed protein product [Brachionus calyciflorus]|uniref:Uncharacterized protein n=1 Tax=Brachionus calyciflorus TaxID=104777 RepID=A0A813WBA4_9BILA|nr:unnamed protein product [Brachionus calyciflorus]